MSPLPEGAKNVWNWQDHCYAELYENGAGSTITITTAGTYYQWVTSSVGQTQGEECIISDGESDSITAGVNGAGIYMVMSNMSFRGGKDAVVEGAVFLDGVKQDNLSFSRFTDSVGDRGSAAISGLLSLVNGNVLTLKFTSDSDGDVVIVYDVNLHAVRTASTP